ncbi:MAG: hypothetical protein NT027_18725 [Proteobacteria bacterium]|nr:hypothetical protein [Pseudomonadota bacterium]
MKRIMIALISGCTFLMPTPLLGQNANQEGSAIRNREKIISREGRSNTGRDAKKIDFNESEISGKRKDPLISSLSNTKAKKEYDLVPIRTEWKPQMHQSASSLDSNGPN